MQGENFVEVMTVDEFKSWGCMLRAAPICKRPEGNQGGKKRLIKDVICAFDIETSNLPDIQQNIMYVWHFAYGEQIVIRGRTWGEYKDLINFLVNQLKAKETLAIYVHNLSYEWQYLKAVHFFGEDDVFAMNARKVIKATCFEKKIEYRCSYAQTNMSLSLFTAKMNVEHVKLSGDDYNYKKIRYPWSDLTCFEKAYGQNDVVGLVEALKVEMALDGDNLYTIPMTSTGYVRRDAKNAMRQVPYNFVKKMQPDFALYKILRAAFRGGDTHANRHYAGMILNNIQCVDESSAYPAVMVNCEYPVKPFEKVEDVTPETYYELCVKYKRPAIFGIRLYNVELNSEKWGSPYIPRDKCMHIDGACYDNGRILRAKALEIYVTDIDMSIINDEYRYEDVEFFDFYVSQYGRLPKSYVDQINEYFRRKNELKGVEGSEILYMKSKNLLNSLYGLMAQDPLRIPLVYGYHKNEFTGENILEIHEKNVIPEDEYNKYINKAFLTYAWGVWVTANARRRLHDGMRILADQGADFVYGDTDSLKYIGNVDWTAYNKERIAESKANGAFATDPKGKKHYMGVFEPDGIYKRFCTWGTKKYAYEDEKGELHITVAGVNKKKGAKELKAAGGLEAFVPGFVFRDAGGVEVIYNDNDCKMTWIEIDGHFAELTSNIYMRDGTYMVTDSSYKNSDPSDVSAEVLRWRNYDINF